MKKDHPGWTISGKLLHVSDPERGIDLFQVILVSGCSENGIILVDDLHLVVDDPLPDSGGREYLNILDTVDIA